MNERLQKAQRELAELNAKVDATNTRILALLEVYKSASIVDDQGRDRVRLEIHSYIDVMLDAVDLQSRGVDKVRQAYFG